MYKMGRGDWNSDVFMTVKLYLNQVLKINICYLGEGLHSHTEYLYYVSVIPSNTPLIH